MQLSRRDYPQAARRPMVEMGRLRALTVGNEHLTASLLWPTRTHSDHSMPPGESSGPQSIGSSGWSPSVFRPVLGHVPKKARPGMYARIVEYPRGLVKFFWNFRSGK